MTPPRTSRSFRSLVYARIIGSLHYSCLPLLLASCSNGQYFLPAIQREFVWKPEQIVQLFDSIMRGYPISSFLFWRLDPGNYDNWQVFQFVQHASHNGTHSTLANINGIQDLTLILDGQQRLTSLHIGLKGTYTIKKRWLRWDNPNAWVQCGLYLDLLKDPPVADDDVEIGIRYGFAFLQGKPAPDEEHFWFEVGKILKFDGQDALRRFTTVAMVSD